MSQFDSKLEECILFIKKHRLDAEQIANKFTMPEVGKICQYLGIKFIKGEREKEQAERLYSYLK